MKNNIKIALEILGILVALYLAFFVLVTIVCLDGTPTGSLYEDLGMCHLRHWLAEGIRWVIGLTR